MNATGEKMLFFLFLSLTAYFFFPDEKKVLLTWGSRAAVDKGPCMSCKSAKGVGRGVGSLI